MCTNPNEINAKLNSPIKNNLLSTPSIAYRLEHTKIRKKDE